MTIKFESEKRGAPEEIIKDGVKITTKLYIDSLPPGVSLEGFDIILIKLETRYVMPVDIFVQFDGIFLSPEKDPSPHDPFKFKHPGVFIGNDKFNYRGLELRREREDSKKERGRIYPVFPSSNK